MSGTHQGEFLGIPAIGKAFRGSHIQIYRFAESKVEGLHHGLRRYEGREDQVCHWLQSIRSKG